MGRSHALLFALGVLLGACNKPAASARVTCFSVEAAKNSPPTRALFGSRRCQGGGVTWAGILGVLASRRGRVEPVVEPTPGWTGSVSTLNGRTRFSIDDEGDQALFCSADAQLLHAVQEEYRRLNADSAALERARAQTSALSLECLEADGGVPALPRLVPPPLPAQATAAARAELERLRLTVLREPSWCFPTGDVQGHTGALRLMADGTAIHVPGPGKPSREGRWSFPRAVETTGDTRIEVDAGILLHLNVGESGRLGFDYTDAKGAPVREELIPGDACLSAP